MTSFTDIADLMLIYVPTDYKVDSSELLDIVRLGLLRYSIITKKTFTYTDSYKDSIVEDMGEKEQYVVALFSYQVYLKRLLDELNRGAINFKTITFEVSTLQERVKSVRLMVKDNEEMLQSVFNSFVTSDEFNGTVSSLLGVVRQVGTKECTGEWYW